MFLFEIIIAIFIFSFFLIFFTINIARAKSMKSVKRLFIGYIFVLVLMGYFYIPITNADLYRINGLINNSYKYMDFHQILILMTSSRNAIGVLYFWIFGVIGNLKLLPAVTAALFYSNIFYIIYKSSIKYNFSTKTISRIVLFFMAGGQFFEVVSGIRTMLAFSIIALCCYKEFFENKSFILNLPFYIIAVFVHDAAFILFVIRVIYIFLQPEKNIKKRIINIILCVIVMLLGVYFAQDLIARTIYHGSRYVNGDVYFYLSEYIFAIFCIIFMYYSILIFYKFKKMNKVNSLEMKGFVNFVTLLLIFDTMFYFEYTIFHRYRTFIMMLILPIIGFLLESSKEDKTGILKNYIRNFQLFFLVTYISTISKGNITGLKFFIFK